MLPAMVAVSGGGDSVALAAGLAQVAAGLGRRHCPRLVLAHLDHGLRPESVEEARGIAALAKRLELPLLTRRLESVEVAWIRGEVDQDPSDLDPRWCSEPGGSARAGIQARARALRRSWLEAAAAERDCALLALGHTQDDQAETVLLRLLRGSGAQGAAGMRTRGPGRAWRPLLGVRRQALRDWLRSQGLPWLDDPTNQDLDFERVRIRQEALPVLERVRPGAAQALAASALRLAQDAAALEDSARMAVDRLWGSEGDWRLPVEGLRALPPAIRERVLDQVCDRLAVPRLGRGARHSWLALVEGEAGGRRLEIAGGTWVRRKGQLEFHPPEDEA